jgi:hypothetical protein
MPDKGHRIRLNDEELHKWAEWRRNRDFGSAGAKSPKIGEADKQLGKAIEYLEEKLDASSAKSNAA